MTDIVSPFALSLRPKRAKHPTAGRLARLRGSMRRTCLIPGVHLWLCGLVITSLLCSTASSTAAPALLRNLGGADMNVVSTVEYGSSIYVGGYFSHAGPVTGSCIALSTRDGAVSGDFPEVSGRVYALASDGSGGWFLGGAFRRIAGTPHGGLAHIDAKQQLVSWDPMPDGDVHALTVLGDTLFVGGSFEHLLGSERRYVAAFGVRSGHLLAPLPAPAGPVNALLASRDRLYAGIDSYAPTGAPDRGLVAYDLDRWNISDWPFDGPLEPMVTGPVRALAITADRLIIGGRVALRDRPGVFNVGALNLSTGVPDPWAARTTGPDDSYYGDPTVNALAVRDSSIYLGGHFSWVDGVRRGGLAKLDLPGATVSSWNPDPGPWMGDYARDVEALAVCGSTLYLGGHFESIGDSTRSFLGAVDALTGSTLSWGPHTNAGVLALGLSGSTLAVGGGFQGVGPEWRESRYALAAFDRATGTLRPWNPQLSGLGVEKLLAVNGKIYVAGYFDRLGGQSRYCLGAVDTVLGLAAEWDPGCSGPVLALSTKDDTLYVGGAFGSMAGQPRSFAAAFETTNGTLLPWSPSPDNVVRVLQPNGPRVFLGGDFSSVNGVTRRSLAAVDATSGTLAPFDVQLSSGTAVTALALKGDTLYLGGSGAGTIGTRPWMRLAAVNATSAALFDWGSLPGGQVTGMAAYDSVVFVSGPFGTISGLPRGFLVPLSCTLGKVLDWDLGFNSTVWGISIQGSTLYAGGGFDEALGSVRASFAGIQLEPAPKPPSSPTTPLSFSSLWPNPASSQIGLDFFLPVSGRVLIAIYDVQGRLTSPPTHAVAANPGRQLITIPVTGLRGGVYLCKVSAGSHTAVRKFLVVR